MPSQYLSLHELAERIQHAVESQFQIPLWVVAEIAALNEASSGHCYLELTDYDEKTHATLANMRAVIWANRYREIRSFFEETTHTSLQKGLQLMLRVRVEYSVRYGLTLQVIDIDPQYTLGELALARQRTLEQLEREGLLYLNRELAFPEFPHRIAVISAQQAAGYQDFCHQLQAATERYQIQLKLFPALVQGDKAVESLRAALERIRSEYTEWDIVVIIRGGGGQMDLSCFDSYTLAATVAQFPLPVVAGIGHERDVSVVDYVANLSVKTPTAVAATLETLFRDGEHTLLVWTREFLPALLGQVVGYTAQLTEFVDAFARSRRAHILSYQQRLLRQLEMLPIRLQALIQEPHHRLTRRIEPTELLIKNCLTTYSATILKQFAEVNSWILRNLQRFERDYFLRILANQGLDPRHALRNGWLMASRDGRLLGSDATFRTGEKITLHAATEQIEVVVEQVASKELLDDLGAETEGSFSDVLQLFQKLEG